MPFECIKTHPINSIVGLICGFPLLFVCWGFLKSIDPGFLLNLAESNACLSFIFDLTFIAVCVTQFKMSGCNSRLDMKRVTFHFFICFSQKNGVTLTDKDNGSEFPWSKYA